MNETGKNGYQKLVKDRLERTFPNCMIFRMDPNAIQGIPDLLILFNDTWASLETKASVDSPHRPNQDYYVNLMARMSFSSFIFPENEDEDFDILVKHLYRN